jgi:type II secretory pathway pseudopilin PulG
MLFKMRKLPIKLTKIKKRSGISMPEIMAGITIMAILAGTGAISAVKRINRAKVVATMTEMKAISEALAQYHADHPGDTITTITTLVTQGYLPEGFTKAPDTDLETNWKKDAWGNYYKLAPPPEIYDEDGDYGKGYLESGGLDGEIDDLESTPDYDETDDNIKIVLEPIVSGD